MTASDFRPSLNVDAIPVELRERPQWVVWKYEQRDGKTTKVPYQARNASVRAKSTAPDTWATLDDALAALDRSRDVDGAGYVFAPDDPFVGIDLDADLPENDRGAIMAALDSYSERSVSGAGVHVIVRATLNGYGRNRKGPFEVYEHGRYFCMTGAHVVGTPTTIEERQAQLETVLARYLPAPEPVEPERRAVVPIDLDDRALLDKAMSARNGPDFQALWNGAWQGRYPSQSEADAALCADLAFWTGRDAARIDSLFRSSGLMREKWNTRRGDSTYGAQTIDHAIAITRETYSPRPGPASNGASLDPGPEQPPPPVPAREPRAFRGRTHDEVLQLEFPPERYLVHDLVPIGAVGSIAGVPETHKSWLAQAIAVRVARGEGTILGCDVTTQARVGYFWQDDSTREEAERVKLFEAAHPNDPGLPIRWYLNEGLILPRDIPELATVIREHQFALLVLDSFYNFLVGASLKDEEAEQVVAQLKTEVADPTGCTILTVDHMPWPTETNRGRLRAYGGVFKNAATRFGIYIDAEGKKLSIEARGNNIKGFKKRPAYWDADQLELRLVEQTDHAEKVEERATAVQAHLDATPGPHSKTAIRKAVKGKAEITDQALELLRERGTAEYLSRETGTGVAGTRKTEGWIASIHAGSHHTDALSLDLGTDGTGLSGGPTAFDPVPPVPLPEGGTGSSGTGSGPDPSSPPEHPDFEPPTHADFG